MFSTLLVLLATVASAPDRSIQLGETYAQAIAEVNAKHARKPGTTLESELAERLPKKATLAFEKLIEIKADGGLVEALEACARAALDLDRVDDFNTARNRLLELDASRAEALGVALSRERILLLGEGGLSVSYLEHFALITEDVLAAYDEVFGFKEFSKVAGKKLRVRLHLEEAIKSPPHFAPQFPFHSEIDFPVIDAQTLNSPTPKGQFMFYGLCHELGHVIAMWGSQSNQEDHHAWAHYTGLVVLEHIATSKRKPKWLSHCRDFQWRSVEKELSRLGDAKPGTGDRDAVLALLFGLHDALGPQAIGEAVNIMDEADKRLRINHVRYYSFRELETTLLASTKAKKLKKRVSALFP